MSNLNDFINVTPSTHIRTTWIDNAYGTGHGTYNETNQAITLHADTRLLRIRNENTGNDLNLGYSLDGSTPDVGVVYDNAVAPTHTPSKMININTENQFSMPVLLKVSGGETFKYNLVAPGGGATTSATMRFIIEEYGY